MKAWGLGLFITAAVVVTGLVGCGGAQSIGLPGMLDRPARRSTTTFTTLYQFGRHSDGAVPTGSLLNVGGTLYGTTASGGAYGEGTVFSITASGQETVLYSFGGNNDGANPNGSLIEVKGTLYGTTQFGGSYNSYDQYGTVFSITPSGSENVLHRFGAGYDGREPLAGLVSVNGTLYGTTNGGGAYNGGTVYSLTISGAEHVLHSFGSGSDGKYPEARLLRVHGALYGTTAEGGTVYLGGTVFTISTSGIEKVLHSFGTGYNNGTDGAIPEAGLINIGRTLYGTTAFGGVSNGRNDPYGTVFSITKDGAEKVLHTFNCCHDGAIPASDLIVVNGELYGSTRAGGKARDCEEVPESGCGTAFSVTTGGTETILHRFSALNGSPNGLIALNGTLYGTTVGSARYYQPRYGTFFALGL